MDTSLMSFLVGYLQGKRQKQAELEAESRVADQYSLQLAQFLEAQKEREAQEKYRQAQLEMGMRQLDISERHQTMLEKHYDTMNAIQRAQLELQQAQNEQQRQEHAWRMMGYQLSLLENTVNLFGDPEKAIGFLRRSPVPAVAEWASNLQTAGLEGMAKAKALPVVMNMVNAWNSDKMPSDKAIISALKTAGLDKTFSLDEVKGLYQLRVDSIRGAMSAEFAMFAKKEELEFRHRKQLLAMQMAQEAQRIQTTKDDNQKLFMAINFLENPVPFITAVSSVPAGSELEIPKMINEIESEAMNLALNAGLPSEVAPFFTTMGLSIMVHTGQISEVTMGTWLQRINNPVYKRSVEKGAKIMFMAKYGREPKGDELRKYVKQYVMNSTKDEEIAQKIAEQFFGKPHPAVTKSAK